MFTTYGQLKNGDVVYIQGYRFRVDGIRISSKAGEKTTMHSEPNRADVIRFTGIALDSSLIGSGYDGGTYGGYADVQIRESE
jgi:hypothetical protein